jgi:ABC-type lipoprotein release transport system permease subunit
VFGGAVLVIVAVTLLATLVPARRAALTDPAVVLRGE